MVDLSRQMPFHIILGPAAMCQNRSVNATECASATHASCPQYELRIQDQPPNQGPEAIPGIA
eukprot:427599-Prorocentrum_lima.AAC.1